MFVKEKISKNTEDPGEVWQRETRISSEMDSAKNRGKGKEREERVCDKTR